MKHKKIMSSVLLLGLAFSAHCQLVIDVAGGDASGVGGTVAYSVGQVIYEEYTGSSGSETQGVQQPYEISEVLDTDLFQLDINLVAYPNPTSDFLTLNVGESELAYLNFQLYDLSGKLIESRKIVNTRETIGMQNLQNDIYILKITKKDKEIKTYKIIKNQK
jgi:hypothetical protein